MYIKNPVIMLYFFVLLRVVKKLKKLTVFLHSYVL